MELERPVRSLEVAVAAFWILLFYVRMRSTRAVTSHETWSQRLRAAVRPVHMATFGVAALCIPLWTAASWQPVAHAVTVPTVVAWGMSWVLLSFASKWTTSEGGTANTPV